VLALAAVAATGCGGGSASAPPPSAPPHTQTPTPAPAPAPAPARTIPSATVGVNAPVLLDDPAADPRLVDAHLAHMERTGVTNVRTDALWAASEPQPPRAGVHRYDWRFGDRVAGALAAHGIRWWPILDYAPSWGAAATGNVHAPPRDPRDYAAFAGAFARRYGPGGAFWREHPVLSPRPVRVYELWNEENTGIFWPPAADVNTYADVFAAAEAALAAADPAGRVIVGGLVPDPAWVPRMVTRRPALRDRIDGVAVHPYSRRVAGVVQHMVEMRAALDAAGMRDVPLEVTEVGWETRPPSARWLASDDQRAALLVRTWRALERASLRVDAYFPYAWTTREQRPDHEDDWYGLVPPGRPGADTAGTRALGRMVSAP
jgi:polysaccharide biosynthesis protein PslG